VLTLPNRDNSSNHDSEPGTPKSVTAAAGEFPSCQEQVTRQPPLQPVAQGVSSGHITRSLTSEHQTQGALAKCARLTIGSAAAAEGECKKSQK
jgi:hypothetical protein